MKSLHKPLTVLILAMFLAPMAVSSAELSLDDCIELALQNRASIIAALGAEKVASAQKRAALGAFMPRLSGSYSYTESTDTDIKSELEGSGFGEVKFPDQDRTSKSLSFLATMSLFEPANWFNYAGARAGRKGASLNVLASEQDLIYSVKVAYYAFLASVENVAVQEEAVKRAEEQLKLIESRFELGSASRSDVLKQKVQHGNDRLAMLRANNSVTDTKAGLAYTIGVDPRTDWRFSTAFSSRQYSGTLDEAIELGLQQKPSLLSAEQRLNAASDYSRAAKMDYLPTVSGWVNYSFSDGTRGDTITFNQSSQSKTFGLQVSYNIFDGFSRENRVSQFKAALNDRRAEFVDARNLTVNRIKTAYFNIEQLQEQLNVSRENVNAADEDLKISQEKYKLGAATILDLLDAQVSLKEAQMSLIQTEFDLNLAIANLENAMGKM
jgi:outer membrane protein